MIWILKTGENIWSYHQEERVPVLAKTMWQGGTGHAKSEEPLKSDPHQGQVQVW
jgi:hypothetical protein